MQTTIRNRNSILKRYGRLLPEGTGALFSIQIFSTLSYSVLYSTLILYITKQLHIADTTATGITGSFIALNYFLHLLGGYIGGRYLSYRSLFSVSMTLLLIGCLMIAVPSKHSLFWGLAIFLAGAGMNSTCLNCMVTQMFEPNDHRRETAFLWNYSGMNLGFFLGFSLSGYMHNYGDYQTLFILSGIGNVVALFLTRFNWSKLKDRHTSYLELTRHEQRKSRLIGIGMVLTLIFVNRLALAHNNYSSLLMLVVGGIMFLLILGLSIAETKGPRNKMLAYLILCLASLVFWTLYQLAPMGLNLFIDRNVDRYVFGILIAPQWVQNINTIIIVIGGPLLSILLLHLREKGMPLNLPLQFAIALFCIGVGFVLLPIGIHFANPQGQTHFIWVFFCYVLQSVGELFISPIGYAMIGQLAPVRLRGLMMGIWMMLTGIAAIFSDYFSKMALSDTQSVAPLITNDGYSNTFGTVGLIAVSASILLLLFMRRITKRIEA